MTITQAHENTGKHENTIRNAIRNGKLKATPKQTYPDKSVFHYDITEEDLKEWLGSK